MYFTNGGYQTGVVASDTPYGPWEDIRGQALLGPQTGNETSSSALDPGVFIDDDGKAYLTYGSGTDGARIRQLGDDMMSFVGEEVNVGASGQALLCKY